MLAWDDQWRTPVGEEYHDLCIGHSLIEAMAKRKDGRRERLRLGGRLRPAIAVAQITFRPVILHHNLHVSGLIETELATQGNQVPAGNVPR